MDRPPALEEAPGVRGDAEPPGDLWVLLVGQKYRMGVWGAQPPHRNPAPAGAPPISYSIFLKRVVYYNIIISIFKEAD